MSDTCPECGGTGHYGYGACSRCGGNGRSDAPEDHMTFVEYCAQETMLDATHGPTRVLLAAEYWRRQCMDLRKAIAIQEALIKAHGEKVA